MNAGVNRCDKVESLEFKHDLDMVGTLMDYDVIMIKEKTKFTIFRNHQNTTKMHGCYKIERFWNSALVIVKILIIFEKKKHYQCGFYQQDFIKLQF